MRIDSRFPRLHIVNHPLIEDKLTAMRRQETGCAAFRARLREITLLLMYEASTDLPMTSQSIVTPMAPMQAPVLANRKFAIVPILRAGLGMSEALTELLPDAAIGHLGMYRGPDKRPVEYLVKLPSIENRVFFLCDPMLATGHSAVHAVDVLKRHGIKGSDIRFLNLLAAPQGVATFYAAHPDVAVWTASLDEGLDANSFILPGLGDAGDRLFNTEG